MSKRSRSNHEALGECAATDFCGDGKDARQTQKLTAMKHNKNHDNGKATGLQPMPVRFEFTHPTAITVCVAGCFNNWQPEAKALHPSGGGRWVKETVLMPGTYEYCLVVDGQWMPDPSARETVPNPFGGRNSVLRVTNSPESTHLSEAEHLPLKNTTKQNLNQRAQL